MCACACVCACVCLWVWWCQEANPRRAVFVFAPSSSSPPAQTLCDTHSTFSEGKSKREGGQAAKRVMRYKSAIPPR